MDNRNIQLTAYHARSGRPQTHRFSSIPDLLKHPAIQYSSLLWHTAPLQHVLDRGCQKLVALRQTDPDAAGLVVASDIEHAEMLTEALEDRGQTVCLVTSKAPDAHERLKAFRDDNSPWIVSVGMVSEGVDIPRLRVCCYLSHIRTEQHFRQVLGRIIRREGDADSDCFLYALNESHLRRYARRVVDDLPEDLASVALPVPASAANSDVSPQAGQIPAPPAYTPPVRTPPIDAAPGGPPSAQDGVSTLHIGMSAEASDDSLDPDLAFSQAFFERLVALRLSL